MPSHHHSVILSGRTRVEILLEECIDADFDVVNVAFGRRGRKLRLAWRSEEGMEEPVIVEGPRGVEQRT
jgi:hypothetical protein